MSENGMGWNEPATNPEKAEDGTGVSDDFPIIKNATLPGRKPTSKYPFGSMTEVNDAFVVYTDKPQYARSSIYTAHKRVAPDIKITIRAVEGGVQVQRIE